MKVAVAASDACGRAREREYGWSGAGIYLNAASFGALPARTARAMAEFNERRQHPFQLPDHEFFGALVQARAALARLIGAQAEEIALAPNTSAGLNLVAGLLLRPQSQGGLADRLAGQRTVLVSDREFPTNVYPWLSLRPHGFHVEILPTDARGLPQERAMLERVRRGDVGVLAISSVQFATGYRCDLEELGDACRASDTIFVVDAIQSVGAVPLDVRAVQPDVLACGGQKWLCSPFGTGFVYVREELVPALRPAHPGWLAFRSSSDFTRLLEYGDELLDDARRFEVGSLAIQDFIGMSRSVELLLQLGVADIWEHVRGIQQPVIDWAARRGVEVTSELREAARSGILCVRPRDAAAAHAALADAGIVCAVREGALRLAPHFYNTYEEMETVAATLDRVG